jgi:hypothetical protein
MLGHGGVVEIEKQRPTHETTHRPSAIIPGDRPGRSFETPCGCRSGCADIALCISSVPGGCGRKIGISVTILRACLRALFA